MTIGQEIKKFRLKKGYTQKQLGEKCVPPIAESTIRRYELGKLNPKIETVQKIAEALNVPVSTLFKINIDGNEMLDFTSLNNPDDVVTILNSIVKNSNQTMSESMQDKLAKPFTGPAKKMQTDEEVSSNPEQNYVMRVDIDRNQRYNIIMLKYDKGEELTQEEKNYVMQYWKDNRLAEKLMQLPAKFKELSEVLRQNYELLNTEGQEKANEQIKHVAEQIELLTKIPDYQKKSEE